MWRCFNDGIQVSNKIVQDESLLLDPYDRALKVCAQQAEIIALFAGTAKVVGRDKLMDSVLQGMIGDAQEGVILVG